MAKRGFSVIDTELHLEEPLDLFDKNLEEPYRSLTRVAGPPEGRLKDGGKRFELGGQVGDNSVNESAQLVQKQSARRLREEPRLLKARTDCRPEVYLEGMDVEGVDVAIVVDGRAVGDVRTRRRLPPITAPQRVLRPPVLRRGRLQRGHRALHNRVRSGRSPADVDGLSAPRLPVSERRRDVPGHAGISDADKRKILWDNGARLFGLEVPKEAALASPV